jgi:alkylation response protein AidB-like acyl-CoA dehydrogenase
MPHSAPSDQLLDGPAAPFRSALRRFLADNNAGSPPRDTTGRLVWQRAWCATLVDGGWAGPTWPRRWGGLDLDVDKQLIYAEEVGRARVPGHPGTGVLIAAPTLIRHGTCEQLERWLPGLLRADRVWAQAFSEPDAGSDLPSLTTRAVRHGDHYVVSGRKVWSSWAEHADGLFGLVRTGTTASRERGISYLVIDELDPGIEIRPIRDITGGSEFCEIIFDEVPVPVGNLIGDEGGGWAIARTSLGHERVALAVVQARFYRRVVDELIEWARRRGQSRDPMWRQRLATLEIDVRLMHFEGARALARVTATGNPGPASSTSRLLNSQIEQRLHELAIDVLGLDGLLEATDPDAPDRGKWLRGFLRTRASTIGAGTAEIQRNTIAERVLGLPRDRTDLGAEA